MESQDDLPPPPPLPPSVEPIRAEESDDLPPPPPLPPNVDPIKAEEAKKLAKPKRALIARPGYGKRGNAINLVTNHFKVSLKTTDEFFHHYYVSF
jgi:eukaryotic translation initiation factor 2C